MLAISLICSRYNGVVLHAHPIRDESHNQRNVTERLQHPLLFTTNHTDRTFFV